MIQTTTGFGETDTRSVLNKRWENHGYCMRYPQRVGQTGVIADLLLFTADRSSPNYSIEIKRITVRRGKKDWLKPSPLNFSEHFTMSQSKYELHKHQLERQVMLSRRCGMIPVLVLKVVKPKHPADTYVFDSEELYSLMKSGAPSLNADQFPEFHRPALETAITNGGSLRGERKGKNERVLQSERTRNKTDDGKHVPVGQRKLQSY